MAALSSVQAWKLHLGSSSWAAGVVRHDSTAVGVLPQLQSHSKPGPFPGAQMLHRPQRWLTDFLRVS